MKWPPDATDHEFSPSWIFNQINGGNQNGSNISDALNLLQNKGCDTLSSFPYNQNDWTTQPSAASMSRAAHYKAKSWNTLSVDTQTFKTVLAGGNPVIIGFNVLPHFDAMNGTTNIVYDTDAGTELGRAYSPFVTRTLTPRLSVHRIAPAAASAGRAIQLHTSARFPLYQGTL